ncbi:MAG: hypothetical protein IT454_01630 [Planctomycetes bacterium]|nr:hypothetical protein [Planctomycetota bacterium]
MKRSILGSARWWIVATLACVGTALIAFAPQGVATSMATQAKTPKYIGSAKCKNCHASAETGDQYGVWQKMGHAKAYEVLASDEAKKVAAEKGIADAQKDDKCLKCHVTAFGVPAEQIAKGFDIKLGVQCESCHGPGEAHMKARLAAAAAEGGDKKPVVLGEGEIISTPDKKLCAGCHNTESPSYKPFCYYKNREKNAHLNPKRERSEAQKKELAKKCGCADKCPTPECAEGKCGVDG